MEREPLSAFRPFRLQLTNFWIKWNARRVPIHPKGRMRQRMKFFVKVSIFLPFSKLPKGSNFSLVASERDALEKLKVGG